MEVLASQPERLVHMCAPMVRYSKLGFRQLVREYGVDVAFTPMILAESFAQSQTARDAEFTTNAADRPLVVQFAAHRVEDFVRAAQLVQPYCDGVDLNCGCPQGWALREGIGACLIHRPDFVADLVRQTCNRCPGLPVSVKIRLHADVRRSVDFSRQIEAAGAAFITVHGRTRDQRAQPVNLPAVAQIKSALRVPVIANGDIRTLDEAQSVRAATGVDGVMAARGILANPAMFLGHPHTPTQCVEDWIRIALGVGTPFPCFHHHLAYMCERELSRSERRIFNLLSSTSAAERRRRAAEAADRRERESDSRGLRDPQAFKAKLAQREELERREAEATQSGGGQLKHHSLITGFFTRRGFFLVFTQISLGTLTQLFLGTSLKKRKDTIRLEQYAWAMQPNGFLQVT
eukprot:maker-scaffold316_size209483-snap-gene-1.39 protein:Tk05947 transcript:maker-scaffold316_size209483-snap-gene-1.39-mRNA-1 annotation:"trna-dihydrouridine(20a 20b) synthase"